MWCNCALNSTLYVPIAANRNPRLSYRGANEEAVYFLVLARES